MSDGPVRDSNSSEDSASSPANASGPTDEPVRVSLFDAVGGSAFFSSVVDHFYESVEHDPVLRPLYPDDLTDARRHTALFLIQYWGGPATYSEERGHPRLRMRHLPFAIGAPERDAWLALMMAAIDATLGSAPIDSLLRHPTEGAAITASARSMFADYFEQASSAMINQH